MANYVELITVSDSKTPKNSKTERSKVQPGEFLIGISMTHTYTPFETLC